MDNYLPPLWKKGKDPYSRMTRLVKILICCDIVLNVIVGTGLLVYFLK